jgi:hypothetical protein
MKKGNYNKVFFLSKKKGNRNQKIKKFFMFIQLCWVVTMLDITFNIMVN